MFSAKLALPRSWGNFLVLFRVNKLFRSYSVKKSAQSSFGFQVRRDFVMPPVTSGRVVYPIPLETPSSRWLSNCLRNSAKHLSTFPVCFTLPKFILTALRIVLGDVGFLSGHFRESKAAGDKLTSAKTEAAEFFRNFLAILNLVVSS